MFSMMRVALVVFAGVTLAACAASTALEPQNQPPSSRTARIYILRPTAFSGAAHPGTVKINGAEVGSAGANSYLFVDRPPGRYKIETAIFNGLEHEVDVEAGRTYYFAINILHSRSNIGRPLGKPTLLTPGWLAEVDASEATATMARMRPPK
jgi:hypothetical protein